MYQTIQVKELNEKENLIIQKTQAFVYDLLKDDTSGHDWWHINRVTHMTLRLAREESGANLFVCVLAALLHDTIDDKLSSLLIIRNGVTHYNSTGLYGRQLSYNCEVLYNKETKKYTIHNNN